MLNMGFKDDVETILDATNAEIRQTVLFSATHPPWVQSVARKYLNKPVTVDVVGAGHSQARALLFIRTREVTFERTHARAHVHASACVRGRQPATHL
eukprot:597454-Pleurochrysis_carterae.AAC.1